MTVLEMRAILKTKTRYSGSAQWRAKIDTMTDAQVTAVYFRLLNTKQLK